MTFPLAGYIGAGALLAGSLAGWTVRDWKADSDALAATEAAQKRYDDKAKEMAAQSLRYEQWAQSNRANERTDRETIREVFRNVSVPTQCAAPPAVVSLLDNAVRDANAAASGQPRSDVPATP